MRKRMMWGAVGVLALAGLLSVPRVQAQSGVYYEWLHVQVPNGLSGSGVSLLQETVDQLSLQGWELVDRDTLVTYYSPQPSYDLLLRRARGSEPAPEPRPVYSGK